MMMMMLMALMMMVVVFMMVVAMMKSGSIKFVQLFVLTSNLIQIVVADIDFLFDDRQYFDN